MLSRAVSRSVVGGVRTFSSQAKAPKIVFMGAPGVGKGTYAGRVGPELNTPVVTAGELVRAAIKEGSDLGKLMQSYTNAGKLVPDDVINKIIEQKLKALDGFLLDGFPRNVSQAQQLLSWVTVDLVVNLSLREDLLVRKICARRLCSNCNKEYNLADFSAEGIDMPPLKPKVDGICDKCQKPMTLIQRADDNEAVVSERQKVYTQETAPVLDFFKKKVPVLEFEVLGKPSNVTPVLLGKIKDQLPKQK
eukprot:gnl/Hemi2/6620_TR2259_c0_g3_i1.p1 gnl/Hemi2/6620_TR2259_c0_g3~~gnl/Hemi2/6620_TR2259_c0_g3_i1.p1  ORF type:complete len:248 (+),score=96.52 gnl/Hemi2/6620_TR2259_c0_g3_i1:70-813(+)